MEDAGLGGVLCQRERNCNEVREVCLMDKFLQSLNDSRSVWAIAGQLVFGKVRLSGWLLEIILLSIKYCYQKAVIL